MEPEERARAELERLVAAEQARDPAAAAEARKQLGSLGAAARVALQGALADRSPAVRTTAIELLGQLGTESLPVLALALGDPSGRVRLAAIGALARLGERAASALAEVVRNGRGALERRRAAERLGQIGSAKGLHALLDGLKDDSADVRIACARAAVDLGPVSPRQARDVVAFLVAEALAGREDREALVLAIENLAPLSGETVPDLRKALRRLHARVRLAAARALGELGAGAEDAAEALRKAIDDKSPKVARAAADALSRVSPDEPVDLTELDKVGIPEGDELLDELIARRAAGLNDPVDGSVTCTVRPLDPDERAEDVRDVLDGLAEEEGFEPLGERWVELEPKVARALCETALEKDPVFGGEVMSKTESSHLADRFMGLFDIDRARYFCNGDWSPTGSGGDYHPISGASFELGLLVHDRAQVGILWVTDEG